MNEYNLGYIFHEKFIKQVLIFPKNQIIAFYTICFFLKCLSNSMLHGLVFISWPRFKPCLTAQSILISHLLLFTHMSRPGRSEKTPLRVMCEWPMWPYVPTNENSDCKNMKMLLNCFACYEQSDLSKHIFIIIYIFMTKWFTCDP